MSDATSEANAWQWVGPVIAEIATNGTAFAYKDVVLAGDVPFSPADLVKLLPPSATTYLNAMPDDVIPDLVIIGQCRAAEELLDQCLRAAWSETRFLPQEAYVDQVLFGYDWWASQQELLDNACDYYPGLAYVRAQCEEFDFEWPSVEAIPAPEIRGDDGKERQLETELHRRGYDVQQGRSRGSRWTVLTRIVDKREMTLNDVAGTIASHCRTRRRQHNGEQTYSRALGEWEFDLRRLKTTYYDGRQLNFSWPSTK